MLFLPILLSILLHPATSFSPPTPSRTLTTKMARLPSNAWTTVSSLPSSAGTIKQLQLWTAGARPADILFRGFFDGASTPQLGGEGSTLGTPALTVALDVLLAAAFPSTENYTGTSTWSTTTSGCNFFDPNNGVGGFLRMDMPFSNGFSLQLFNGGAESNYWVIVTYIPLANPPPSPLRLFIKPFCVTGLASTVGTYPEFSLLSASGPAGAYLKGLKVFVEAPVTGISWAEGKFRFYAANASAPPFPVNAVHNYSTPSRDDKSWYNQQTGVDMMGSSSGGEDFFLSGFDWRGLPCFAQDLAGTVHCEFYGQAISRVTAYRFYSEEGFGVAGPNETLVASFTVNDQNFAVPSSVNFFLGLAYYYA